MPNKNTSSPNSPLTPAGTLTPTETLIPTGTLTSTEALTPAEALIWHDLVMKAPLGIFISTPEGRFLFVNPAMAQMFGYAGPEEMRNEVTDIAGQLYAASAEREVMLQHLIDHGELQAFPCRMVRRNGVEFTVSLSVRAVRGASGQIEAFQGFATDITAQQAAEAELVKSRTILAEAEKLTGSGGWEWNSGDNMCIFSPNWMRIHGVTTTRLSLSALMPIAHPDDRPKIEQAFAETMRTGRPYDIEHRIVRQDRGDIRHVQARGAVQRDDRGHPLRIYGSCVDVTEQRKILNQLHDTNRRLKAALAEAAELSHRAEAAQRTRNTFLAGLSHDIRAPLSSVIGFAALLVKDPVLTPAQRDSFQTIYQSASDVLGIINDILEISAIEAGQIHLRPVSFSLHDLLADLENQFTGRCIVRGLELILEREVDMPEHLYGDATKYKQVLINLLSNAVKFAESGRIRLRISGRIASGPATAASGAVELLAEVEDHGPGISAADQDVIFDPFVKGRKPSSTGGTGLGLTISRHYARLLGGDLRVTSTPGQGSCFQFTAVMPKTPAPSDDRQPTPSDRQAPAITAETVRILVVNDNPVQQTLLNTLLKQVGFEVYSADNGRQALELFQNVHFHTPPTVMLVDEAPGNLKYLQQVLRRNGYRVVAFPHGKYALKAAAEQPPDIILLDIMMPDLDGFEVCRRLKADDRLKDIPVLFISVLSDHAEKARAFAAGGVDYVTKPFEEQEVLHRVTTHLRLYRLTQQLEQTVQARTAELAASHAALKAEMAVHRRLSLEMAHANQLITLGALVAGVAHEINNPIQTVHLNASILEEMTPLLLKELPKDGPHPSVNAVTFDYVQKQVPELIRDIRLSAERVEKIVALLKNYAARQDMLTFEPTAIEDVLSNAVRLLRRRIRNATTRFEMVCPPDLPRVNADRQKLEQVFINLITNALEALTGADQGIRITGRYDRDRGQVVVAVQDDGEGIAPENLSRVLNPFFTTKRHLGGTGMGLSIVQNWLALHDGAIDIQSTPETGTTFQVRLPQMPPETNPQQQEEPFNP